MSSVSSGEKDQEDMTVDACQSEFCQVFSAKIYPMSTPAVAISRPSAEASKPLNVYEMLCDDTWNYCQNKPLGLGLPPDVCTAFQLNTAQSKGIISNEESGFKSCSSKQADFPPVCGAKVQLIWTLTANTLTWVRWDWQ